LGGRTRHNQAARPPSPLQRQPCFRLTRQALPDQSEVLYAYDDAGNLTSLTPPGRPAHAFAYTPGGLTRLYDPPGSGADTTHYEYNLDRQLTRIDRPDTQSVRLVYDAVKGRLDSLASTRGEALAFGYSAATGQLEVLQRAGADATALAFTYGGALLEGETWTGAVSGGVSVSYDANFWPTTQTVSAGGASVPATYGYDDDGLVDDVVIAGQTYDLTPDAATGLLSATSLGSLTTTSHHNAHAELDSTRARFGGTSLYAAQYGRDDLGRITRWTETVQGQTTDREYEYDLLGRLWQVRDAATDAQLERYAYGANGNRDSATVSGVTRSATYDDQDRQLADGSATFTYTGAGERRRRVDGAQSQTTTYDALGNLRSVELSDGTAITYVVDGRNRRVGRKVNGTWTQRWLYQNALSVAAELDGAGALKKRFVYASRGHVPDVMVVRNASGPDSTYRLITDHLGSVRLVVNAASGTVAQRMSYDAWGNVTEDTSPGLQPFGYAGGLYDPATGLVRFGARDYDAKTGRWLSRDPIQFSSATTNLYSYASSSPVDRLDPRGLATDESLEHQTLARLSAPCVTASPGGGRGEDWWALPWTPNGIVRRARQDLVRVRPPENYRNAWEHARGGELARAKYGWPLAIAASAAKETQDYLIDRQGTTETFRDLANTSQGILGPTRGADGRPILDGLWPSNQPNKRRAGDY
jgi:RHS repeat-associated protein